MKSFKRILSLFLMTIIVILFPFRGHYKAAESSKDMAPLSKDFSSLSSVGKDPIAGKEGKTGPASLPESTSQSWWETVQRDIAESEYNIKWKEGTYLPDIKSAYQATNRKHNFRTYFSPEGISVIPRNSEKPEWIWGISLKRYGPMGNVQPVSKAGLSILKNRIEYSRGNLTEWYINDKSGLEQGFTLKEQPESSTANTDPWILFEMEISGNLKAMTDDNGDSIDFFTKEGKNIIHFSKLHALDSTGKKLPARFRLAEARLEIQVNTTGALFPITIDPTIVTHPKVWIMESEQLVALYGCSVASAGDVNGDGYDDVIIGAPNWDGGETDSGAAWLYLGSASGLSTTHDWIKECVQANAHYGNSVAGAGDVNGDGYDDIIIGAQDWQGKGGVWVHCGSASGLSKKDFWSSGGDSSGDRYGFSVASAGDVNGDGYDDVIIGGPYRDGKGAAWIKNGSASGLGNFWFKEGDQGNAQFGYSVASAGDVNNDGYDDVIVGEPYWDGGYNNEGRALVYYGSASGIKATGSWWWHIAYEDALFGCSVAPAGDVNGDGYDDFIIGAQGWEGKGGVWVGTGSAAGLPLTWAALGDQSGALFGNSVAGAGDVNGDGYDDVIVGAPLWNGPGGIPVDVGRALVYLGSDSGLSTNPTWRGTGQGWAAYYGCSVAGAGDVNGDGHDDIIVGAEAEGPAALPRGRAYVYHECGAVSTEAIDNSPQAQLSSAMQQEEDPRGNLPERFFTTDNFSPLPGNHRLIFYPELKAKRLIEDREDHCYWLLKGFYGTSAIPEYISVSYDKALLNDFYVYTPNFTQNDPNNWDSSIKWEYQKVYKLTVSTNIDPSNTHLKVAVSTTNSERIFLDANVPLYFPENTSLVLATDLEFGLAPNKKRCTGTSTLSGDTLGGSYTNEGDRKLFFFVLNSNTEIRWIYKQAELKEVGLPISPPDTWDPDTWDLEKNIVEFIGSQTGDKKSDSLYWDSNNHKLYPTRPIAYFEIKWDDTNTIAGYSDWPAPDISIVTAPVNLQPPGALYKFEELCFSGSYAMEAGVFTPPDELKENRTEDMDPIFRPQRAGFSLLRFSSNSNVPVFMIVEAVSLPDDLPTCPWTIGNEITNTNHDDPEGRNGYVYFENAYYDGYGPDKAYDRESRTGPIIPVNKLYDPNDLTSDRQMVVAWYTKDDKGIGWPYPANVISYKCEWPDTPDGKIIIASGNGTKPLAEYEYKGKIYYQNDPGLPGYNPNEEHALIMGNKAFAIRNDLNKTDTPNSYTSEPYALLKYKSPETGAWRMKIFKVEATGTDEDGKSYDFTYPITAGSLISPLTPLDLFPQSQNSYMKSGADWHYEDHKKSHWAKAAGQVNFVVRDGPHTVTAVDVNQDNKMDLVVANKKSNNISVLLASRDPDEKTPGYFKDGGHYGAVYETQAPAIGDLNDDQIPDRVIANTSQNKISVYLGIGDGKFQEDAALYPVGEGPCSVTIGSVNSDSFPDLVVANSLSNNVSVLLGNGNGTFQGAVHYEAGNAPRSVAIGDLNNDGSQDLAVANSLSNNVSVLLGNGDDTDTFQAAVHYKAGDAPQSVAIADLNNDLRRDLVVVNALSKNVSVLLGYGKGTFQEAQQYPAGDNPKAVTIGHFNEDTAYDLVVLNSYRNKAFVIKGNGNGTFQDPNDYAVVDGAHSVPVGDFDADSKPDLVVAKKDATSVYVLLDNGNNSFNVLKYSVGGHPQGVALGDFNEDTLLDLAVGIEGTSTTTLKVFLGKEPSGQQAEFETTPKSIDVKGIPHTLISGDFDGDKKIDLAMINQEYKYVSVLQGQGDGTFSILSQYPDLEPYYYATGDFDGRGTDDIAVPIEENNIVSLRFNTTDPNSSDSTIVMHWYYPLQPGFYYPLGSNMKPGDPVPFLNGGENHVDLPRDVNYVVGWPTDVPVLYVGETLTEAKYGLPDLVNMAAAEVIFDENVYNGKGPLAKLFDPFTDRWVELTELPTDISTERKEGKFSFPDLPYSLCSRLYYDPLNKKLIFKGISYDQGIGEPLVLTNVMTVREKDRLEQFNPEWAGAIGQLFDKTRDPQNIGSTGRFQNPYKFDSSYEDQKWADVWGIMLGLEKDKDNNRIIPQKLVGLPMALTAGMAAGEGYIVLAENDDESLGAAPVQLHVIKVGGGPYQGEIKVIKSDNPFDEKLTLRHSGDFGGEPDNLYFEWYYKADQSGLPPLLTDPNEDPEDDGWSLYPNEMGPGVVDITIEGPGKFTLSDNWFMVRYYYGDQPDNRGVAYPSLVTEPEDPLGSKYWSKYAGAPGGDRAQLAEGWIKRVVSALNPLDARVKDFFNYATNTDVSMISQLGQRYEGDIALSGAADNLNNLGLIEAYETVLNRGEDFSINSVPPVDYGPCNNALLNAATRIATFYTLLGNEAYADAQDPTIGFDTKSGELGSMASSIFAFQNQLDSLLGEELALLRGRDDSMSSTRAKPVYNRLIWNFTNGDGELAYVQTYNISDRDDSGVIDELDAKIMYPQGHGDAWGQYLTAMTVWYKLLRHENYTWEPRIESVLVGGAPVPVDYLDERKFAETAAAKARTGAEIVNLTYRQAYVDDPAGQWQGYKDTDNERSWGVDSWARRAGQGAYFDWVTANAMLPFEDPVKTHTGITRIDRTTVPELKAIATQYTFIQSQADQADQGLNPLGLAKGVVPFDIDPYQLTPDRWTKTHFEQIYDRAIVALQNSKTAFDYATQHTLMLRSNEDDINSFRRGVKEQEQDYLNRLIEIFGYPYDGDIGPGGTYAAGYDGPDWIHFMYVDLPDLTGEPFCDANVAYQTNFSFKPNDLGSSKNSDFSSDELLSFNEKLVHQKIDPNDNTKLVEITYHINTDNPWMQKPDGWGKRRAPGEIQMAMSELIKAHANYKRGLSELEGMIGGIQAAVHILEARYGVFQHQIKVKGDTKKEIIGYDAALSALFGAKIILERIKDSVTSVTDAVIAGLPDMMGFSTDCMAPVDSAIKTAKSVSMKVLNIGLDAATIGERGLQVAKEYTIMGRDGKLFIDDARFEVQQMVKELECMEGDVRAKLQELYMLQEVIHQNMSRYLAALARGERLLTEREVFRKRTAGIIQDSRYQDWSFRIFRNDAVQKYRATFDLASRYAYLAATAYDYETNLLGSDSGAGQTFLTDIVKRRSPGVIMEGKPMAGKCGLADPLARLSQNFEVYKTQLGFNNPQTETNRFSLRRECFRLRDGSDDDNAWRAKLEDPKFCWVPDLWQIPDFRRFCRAFAPESMGEQPGLAIPFSTEVVFGYNYFGWPLGGGDSAYDPSNFATKIRSVGVWFTGYDKAGLSQTPRVYLVPVGADVLRSPSGDGFSIREWLVVDQKLPVPFPILDSEIYTADWIPVNDTLSDELGAIRRFSSFRAYPDWEGRNDAEAIAAETTTDSRLIGRSVWNKQWMLIIPGGTLHHDPEAGLDAFINYVTDIKLFFQTYAYSGN